VLEGDSLTLSNAEATLNFLNSEVANPDRSLAGPTWAIDTYLDGEIASAVNVSVYPTVVFGEDGRLQVFTGCTNGVGSYIVDGSTLTLGPVGYDDVVCEDESFQWADTHIQQVLSEGTLTYEVDAARLTLERGSAGLSARTE